MKFLCVPCDEPMKMRAATAPDRGSLSVVYTCPACDYEIAMLTNPLETQLVQSLGVRIGPKEVPLEGLNLAREGAGSGAAQDPARCPFSGMLTEMGLGGDAGEAGQGSTSSMPSSEGGAHALEIGWTSAAAARLYAIPEFVRPMARTGIERFARERGYPQVDERVLDEARSFFGM